MYVQLKVDFLIKSFRLISAFGTVGECIAVIWLGNVSFLYKLIVSMTFV